MMPVNAVIADQALEIIGRVSVAFMHTSFMRSTPLVIGIMSELAVEVPPPSYQE